MRKKFLKIILTISIIVTSTNLSFAHPGRTDSNSGHKDNKNQSGLGYYHYHCGGYPAHLHNNGVCPYKSTSSTGTSNKENTTTTTNNKTNTTNQSNIAKEKQTAKNNGYNKGYKDGYNSNTFDDSSNETYSTEYKNGYKQGYDKGVTDFNTKKEELYNKGYDDGLIGSDVSVSETNDELIESYNNGYAEGHEKYVDTHIKEYILMGEEDATAIKGKYKFMNSVDEELIQAYNDSYDKTLKNLENQIYQLGFETAILGKKYTTQRYTQNEKEVWFENGYKDGIEELEVEKELVYKSGLKGETFNPSEKFEKVRKELYEQYCKGKKKGERQDIIIGGLFVFTIIGLINKNKILNYVHNIKEKRVG